jgi:hypothetical protein
MDSRIFQLETKEEKCKDDKKKPIKDFSFLRGSNYSPTVPSSRIRLPKHFSSAYALDE